MFLFLRKLWPFLLKDHPILCMPQNAEASAEYERKLGEVSAWDGGPVGSHNHSYILVVEIVPLLQLLLRVEGIVTGIVMVQTLMCARPSD